LTAAISSTDTSIPVDNTDNYILGSDTVSSYIRIDDEIIKVASITATSFDGCTRGQLGTVATSHDNEAEVTSVYRVQGNAIEIALKLMLSSGGSWYSSISPIAYNEYDGHAINGIYFHHYNYAKYYGLVVGDKIKISNSTSNDGIYTISGMGILPDNYSFIEVEETLVTESVGSSTAEYQSKYDVFPTGCSMRPDEVDVNQFEYILD